MKKKTTTTTRTQNSTSIYFPWLVYVHSMCCFFFFSLFEILYYFLLIQWYCCNCCCSLVCCCCNFCVCILWVRPSSGCLWACYTVENSWHDYESVSLRGTSHTISYSTRLNDFEFVSTSILFISSHKYIQYFEWLQIGIARRQKKRQKNKSGEIIVECASDFSIGLVSNMCAKRFFFCPRRTSHRLPLRK